MVAREIRSLLFMLCPKKFLLEGKNVFIYPGLGQVFKFPGLKWCNFIKNGVADVIETLMQMALSQKE